MAPFLRILRTPLGAAPEHVRRAWIGVEIPIIEEKEFFVQSVLETELPKSRLQLWWWKVTGRLTRRRGFSVSVRDALSALERERPLEASWWRQNAPHVCTPGQVFIFDTECGERVELRP